MVVVVAPMLEINDSINHNDILEIRTHCGIPRCITALLGTEIENQEFASHALHLIFCLQSSVEGSHNRSHYARKEEDNTNNV